MNSIGPREPPHDADRPTSAADDRAPWQAPELTVIASVQDATLGVNEGGADGGAFFSSAIP